METIHHIFQNISQKDIASMMICFHATQKTYGSGEYVCTYGENREQIGIVIDGEIQLLRTHADGRQTLLERMRPGNIFGEPLTPNSPVTNTLQIYSASKSKILYMDYAHLIKRCYKACPCHSQLVNNALLILAQKTVQLNERLEVLSQRTIREKLQSYFSILAAQNQSLTFQLPFSYSLLADYLSVDRSAMMRELKKMREDGLIETDRHTITLLFSLQ